MPQLNNVSINQLRMLAHLLSVQSVTETAYHFETSQPRVSRLLGDMRRRFDDPLLVRSGERMVVTERGSRIRDRVVAVLDQLVQLAQPERSFEPLDSTREFKMAFTDSNMVTLVPAVLAAIADAGPKLRTRVRVFDRSLNVKSAMEEREIDVMVDCVSEYTRDAHERFRFAPLGEDDVVLMARRGHPIVSSRHGAPDDYFALDHIAPYPVSDFEKGPIDGSLAALKTPRRIQCFVPEYNLIPYVVMQSDLVFTTCRRFAEHYARLLPIDVVEAPAFFPKMEFRLLWHEMSGGDPANRWLRQTIVDATGRAGA